MRKLKPTIREAVAVGVLVALCWCVLTLLFAVIAFDFSVGMLTATAVTIMLTLWHYTGRI